MNKSYGKFDDMRNPAILESSIRLTKKQIDDGKSHFWKLMKRADIEGDEANQFHSMLFDGVKEAT